MVACIIYTRFYQRDEEFKSLSFKFKKKMTIEDYIGLTICLFTCIYQIEAYK